MDTEVNCTATKIDGWMDDATIFQSNQDDGKLIMKGCVQWNHV